MFSSDQSRYDLYSYILYDIDTCTEPNVYKPLKQNIHETTGTRLYTMHTDNEYWNLGYPGIFDKHYHTGLQGGLGHFSSLGCKILLQIFAL